MCLTLFSSVKNRQLSCQIIFKQERNHPYIQNSISIYPHFLTTIDYHNLAKEVFRMMQRKGFLRLPSTIRSTSTTPTSTLQPLWSSSLYNIFSIKCERSCCLKFSLAFLSPRSTAQYFWIVLKYFLPFTLYLLALLKRKASSTPPLQLLSQLRLLLQQDCQVNIELRPMHLPPTRRYMGRNG